MFFPDGPPRIRRAAGLGRLQEPCGSSTYGLAYCFGVAVAASAMTSVGALHSPRLSCDTSNVKGRQQQSRPACSRGDQYPSVCNMIRSLGLLKTDTRVSKKRLLKRKRRFVSPARAATT